MKPSGELFLERKQSMRLGVDAREASRKPRGREAHPTPLGVTPTLVGPLGVHRPTSSSYIYPYTPKTSEATMKNYFHCRNLLYPRDPILEPSPALRRTGNRSRRASTSSPRPLRLCVSSLPQTFGSILIS